MANEKKILAKKGLKKRRRAPEVEKQLERIFDTPFFVISPDELEKVVPSGRARLPFWSTGLLPAKQRTFGGFTMISSSSCFQKETRGHMRLNTINIYIHNLI